MIPAVKTTCRVLSIKLVSKFKNKSCALIMSRNKHEPANLALHNYYTAKVKEFIPILTPDLHKGECGRVGLIGGSAEYTGAPYFAALSALRSGADLVYVFCCKEASRVIKTYSPELIVLPILDGSDALLKIEPWLSRLHVLVIGPGLGREPGVLKNVAEIMSHCSEKTMLPLVIDADGLFLVTENINLICNYKGPIILTPNAVEYSRLSAKFSGFDPLNVARELNAVVIQKGLTDIIINGIGNKKYQFDKKEITIKCNIEGSSRRCGGQGDILSGCLGTFIAWYQLHRQKQSLTSTEPACNEDKLIWFKNNMMGYSWACYGACVLTRMCSRLAFEKYGRSMTASDMISFIHEAFTSLFGL